MLHIPINLCSEREIKFCSSEPLSLSWLIHWHLINSVKVSYLTSLHLCPHLYNRETGLNEITYNFTYGLSFSLITAISSKHYRLGYHYPFLEAKLSVIKPLEDFERIMWICNTLGLKPVIMVSFYFRIHPKIHLMVGFKMYIYRLGCF